MEGPFGSLQISELHISRQPLITCKQTEGLFKNAAVPGTWETFCCEMRSKMKWLRVCKVVCKHRFGWKSKKVHVFVQLIFLFVSVCVNLCDHIFNIPLLCDGHMGCLCCCAVCSGRTMNNLELLTSPCSVSCTAIPKALFLCREVRKLLAKREALILWLTVWTAINVSLSNCWFAIKKSYMYTWTDEFLWFCCNLKKLKQPICNMWFEPDSVQHYTSQKLQIELITAAFRWL